MKKVETIGELREALKGVPDDVAFQFLFDGADYRKLDVTDCYPNEDGRFVRIEPSEE